jgi:hypothetical protein
LTVPHVSFVQLGVTHLLVWQTVPFAQLVPQSSTPPQPSEMSPHWAPATAHVVVAHDAAPHTLADPPPPQVCPVEQLPVPHVIAPPQPSGYCPQFAPAWH